MKVGILLFLVYRIQLKMYPCGEIIMGKVFTISRNDDGAKI